MKISIIVCTYNRSQILPGVLESIARSRLDDNSPWEILVVDNNSTDATRAVTEEFCRKWPGRFHYLFEPQQGKSFALNSGIRQARGEILVFTDDDVTVEPDWLHNLTAPLCDGRWIGVGGRTLPLLNVPLPAWVLMGGEYDMGGILCAHFDRGDQPCELQCAPYGANMAYRKRAFETYGGFRTDLGASPSRKIPRPNEDTEFGRRLMAAGERLRYEPWAIVRHPVPPERLRKQYFLEWYFDFGRAGVREIRRRPDILGIPRRYFTLLKAVAWMAPGRILRWMFTWSPERRFFRKCWVWMAGGEISEIYRRWFTPVGRSEFSSDDLAPNVRDPSGLSSP